MGGYRSEPELTKLSIFEKKVNTTYAIKEMCGNIFTIKDGENIWKTHLLLSISFQKILVVPFLLYLMDMEVIQLL